MSVVRFDPGIHLTTIAKWFDGHGHHTGSGPRGLYPRVGFVVDDAAAGFLYRTDAPLVGYLDGFVTCPTISPRVRLAAVEQLVQALTAEAEVHGITHLWAFPGTHGLSAVGQRCGFHLYGEGYACLMRVAGKDSEECPPPQ